MATTSTSLCNTALLLVGADVINSFSDNTASAQLANQVYSNTKESYLQSYPWMFSLKQAQLGQLLEEPLFKWKYQYQLPNDFLRMLYMKDDAPYEIVGDKIYTDQKECIVLYQYNVIESEMPAYFVRAFEFQLARIFAISLQEDINKTTLFDQMATKENVKARSIDSQQKPNTFIPLVNYTTINVRE